MTEEQKQGDEDRGTRSKVEDGIRSGLGALSAFRDALEETIREARERGDLSADRARELVKEAVDKAQSAASGARDRLDFAHQAEFESLVDTVEELTQRVETLENAVLGREAPAQSEEAKEEGSDPG